MDMVTVHWVAESSTAGWPCTLLRVTHVGAGATGCGAVGSVEESLVLVCLCFSLAPMPMSLSPGGEQEGEAGAEATVSMLGARAGAPCHHPVALLDCRGPVLLSGHDEARHTAQPLQVLLHKSLGGMGAGTPSLPLWQDLTSVSLSPAWVSLHSLPVLPSPSHSGYLSGI